MKTDKRIEQDFNKNAATDPSVQYAEAVMNGDSVVTVTVQDGHQTTYFIGQEYKFNQ